MKLDELKKYKYFIYKSFLTNVMVIKINEFMKHINNAPPYGPSKLMEVWEVKGKLLAYSWYKEPEIFDSQDSIYVGLDNLTPIPDRELARTILQVVIDYPEVQLTKELRGELDATKVH